MTVFHAIPRVIGQKLKYVNLSREIRAADLKHAIHMLALARLCSRVHHTAANGIPLDAQLNRKVFKLLSLDTGLVLSALGLNAADLETLDLMLANAGAIMEQFMNNHESPLALRFNLDLPSLTQAEGSLPTGQPYSYPLLTLPVYMVEQANKMATAHL